MKTIPETAEALVLRTDFSDDGAWQALCEAIQEPAGDFRAYVECVSDPEYDGLTVDQLMSLTPDANDGSMSDPSQGYTRNFLFLADRTTFTHAECPLLVIDLLEEPGRTFRVVPSATWGVENNLTLLNMNFSEFADSVDSDGIFRDFRTAETEG